MAWTRLVGIGRSGEALPPGLEWAATRQVLPNLERKEMSCMGRDEFIRIICCRGTQLDENKKALGRNITEKDMGNESLQIRCHFL